MMGVLKIGTEAQEQAAEWGYTDNLEQVTVTRESTQLSCKWVWEKTTGVCLSCGDMDFNYGDDD